MALWKEPSKSPQNPESPESGPARFDMPSLTEPKPKPKPPAATTAPAAAPSRERALKESLIAPDIAIEGKIEGTGHVRIAGQFKGDIDVRGDLTIESNAKVDGSIRAEKIVIAGELNGNIDGASHVELMPSGVLTGDVKAASMAVASGAKMRGQADFGWDDAKSSTGTRRSNGADTSHGNGA